MTDYIPNEGDRQLKEALEQILEEADGDPGAAVGRLLAAQVTIFELAGLSKVDAFDFLGDIIERKRAEVVASDAIANAQQVGRADCLPPSPPSSGSSTS